LSTYSSKLSYKCRVLRCPEAARGVNYVSAAVLGHHVRTNHPHTLFDCPHGGCRWTGSNGFRRRDHPNQRLRYWHRRESTASKSEQGVLQNASEPILFQAREEATANSGKPNTLTMDTITDGLTEATNDLAEFYDILQAQDLFQLPEGIAEDTELAQTGARILEIQVQKERAILRAEEMEKKIKQLRMIIKELRELRELKDDQSSNDGSAQTEIQRLMMEMQALVSEVHEMILRASLDETKNESVPEYFQDITEFTKAANKSGIRRSSTDSQGRSVSDPGSYTAQELVSASVSEDGQMFGTEPNIDVETPPKSVMSFVTTTRATFRLLSDRVRSSLWKLGIPLVQTPSIPPTAQSGLKSFEDVFRWYQGLESQQSRKLKGGHLVRTVVSSIIGTWCVGAMPEQPSDQ